MRLMTETYFIIAMPFIFPFAIIVPHKAALFTTSLSRVIHHQPLFWWNITLVLSILLTKKDLKKEEYITGMLEVAIAEG